MEPPLVHHHDRHLRLDRPARAERVPDVALRRGDRHGAAEHVARRSRLRDVAGLRRRAVSVHVPYRVRRKPRVRKRARETRGHRLVVRIRHVSSVRVLEEPDDLCEDLRPARLRPFVLLENERPRAFADDESVAARVVRSRRRFRRVVPERRRVERVEDRDLRRGELLRPAGDHHVLQSVLDELVRVPDRERAGGAGRSGRNKPAVRFVVYGEVARSRLRHELDVRAARHVLHLVRHEHRVEVEMRAHRAGAASVRDAAAPRLQRRRVEARLRDRLLGRGEGVFRDRTHRARRLARPVSRTLEAREASEMRVEPPVALELGNHLNAVFKAPEARRRIRHALSERGDDSHPRYDDPSHAGL